MCMDTEVENPCPIMFLVPLHSLQFRSEITLPELSAASVSTGISVRLDIDLVFLHYLTLHDPVQLRNTITRNHRTTKILPVDLVIVTNIKILG